MSSSAHCLLCAQGALKLSQRNATDTTDRMQLLFKKTRVLDSSKPPILAIPPEIRLMIYPYLWETSPNIHTSRQPAPPGLRKQLRAMWKLGAICRQIRNEAFDEYFKQTQAYFRWDASRTLRKARWHTRDKEMILSSSFLRSHLRHVSFNWTDYVLWTGPGRIRGGKVKLVSPTEVLIWLQKLESLRTVELVISDFGWDVENVFNLAGRFYGLSDPEYTELLNLSAGLEKLTIKCEVERDRVAIWEHDEDWQDFNEEVKELVASFPPQVSICSSVLNLHLLRTRSEESDVWESSCAS